MRIVSQDGMFDVPYERVVIRMLENPFNVVISALFEREDYMNDIVMGYYSTKGKALKVMKMMREAYNKRSLMEMTYSDGNLSKLSRTVGKEELADICSNVFQFPKDDEIEV